MYHPACKVEFQPFNRSYSQLTFHFFNKIHAVVVVVDEGSTNSSRAQKEGAHRTKRGGGGEPDLLPRICVMYEKEGAR